MKSVTRDDWQVVNLALGLTLIVGAAPFVASVIDWIRGNALTFETSAVVPPPAVDDPGLASGVSGEYTGDAVFTIVDATAGQWLASLLPALATLLVTVACVILTRRVARNAKAGDPFQNSSRRATRALGMILFCYGLLQPLLIMIATTMISLPMQGGEVNIAARFSSGSWWPVVVGLVVAVIGEVIFGRGRQLADDAEGLV